MLILLRKRDNYNNQLMSSQKPKKKIIYTTSESPITTFPREQHSSSVKATQGVQFPFPYCFNDYLKFVLNKLIPAKGITFIPEAGRAIGLQHKLKQLDAQARAQLNQNAYRFIKFKKNADVDELEFALDPKHHARIIRSGVIMRALKQLRHYQHFDQNCEQLQDKLEKERRIMVRVPKNNEKGCLQQIELILKEQHMEQSQQVNSINAFKKEHQQSSQAEEIQQSHINYYNMQQNEKEHSKEQFKMAVSTYTYAQSSSLVLTEQSLNESSLVLEKTHQ